MVKRPFEINYSELPHLLKEFVNEISVQANDGKTVSNGLNRIVSEREYYTAFENLLQHAHYRDDGSTYSATDSSSRTEQQQPQPTSLTEKQHQELATFHLNKCLSTFVIDHAAHRKYAYYPSNAYPMGSTMEYTFFMRQWIRNVNYSHVRRLYDRSGDFTNVLSHVERDLCPCDYLIHFNVFERFEYELGNKKEQSSANEQGGGEVLCLLAVENELMMRSDFFSRRKEYYQTFNMWFYDRFLHPSSDLHDKLETVSELRPGLNSHQKYETRSRKLLVARTKKNIKSSLPVDARKSPPLLNSLKYKRLQCMKDISSRLLFGRTGERQLLVRCEDYTSCLYSPKLKVTSCRHLEEDVRFEQRRCGDEIRTEIRTCRKCGKVKVIAN